MNHYYKGTTSLHEIKNIFQKIDSTTFPEFILHDKLGTDDSPFGNQLAYRSIIYDLVENFFKMMGSLNNYIIPIDYVPLWVLEVIIAGNHYDVKLGFRLTKELLCAITDESDESDDLNKLDTYEAAFVEVARSKQFLRDMTPEKLDAYFSGRRTSDEDDSFESYGNVAITSGMCDRINSRQRQRDLLNTLPTLGFDDNGFSATGAIIPSEELYKKNKCIVPMSVTHLTFGSENNKFEDRNKCILPIMSATHLSFDNIFRSYRSQPNSGVENLPPRYTYHQGVTTLDEISQIIGNLGAPVFDLIRDGEHLSGIDANLQAHQSIIDEIIPKFFTIERDYLIPRGSVPDWVSKVFLLVIDLGIKLPYRFRPSLLVRTSITGDRESLMFILEKYDPDLFQCFSEISDEQIGDLTGGDFVSIYSYLCRKLENELNRGEKEMSNYFFQESYGIIFFDPKVLDEYFSGKY